MSAVIRAAHIEENIGTSLHTVRNEEAWLLFLQTGLLLQLQMLFHLSMFVGATGPHILRKYKCKYLLVMTES